MCRRNAVRRGFAKRNGVYGAIKRPHETQNGTLADNRRIRRRGNLELKCPATREVRGRSKLYICIIEEGVLIKHEAAIGIGRFRLRQNRVCDHPVRDTANCATRRPFAIAEVAIRILIEVARTIRATIILPRLARRAVDDIRRGDGEFIRDFRKTLFIVVIDIHNRVRHQHLRLRDGPGEVRVAQKAIECRNRTQVVSPRVAVTLRILKCRVILIYLRVIIGRVDIIIHRIGDFARRYAACEVPHQTVIEWRGLNGRVIRPRATPQKREFLF